MRNPAAQSARWRLIDRAAAQGQFRFVARVLTSRRIDALLPKCAFAAFARRYNGPGFVRNAYDTKLAKAYGEARA